MKWLIPTLTTAALFAYLGCSQVVRHPQGGSGGDGEGGAAGQGGDESGGNSGSGGVADTGGSAAGGNEDTGGTTSSGGDQGSGGDESGGSGGTGDSGGTQSGGGQGSGGSPGSGGTTSTGTNACNTTAASDTVAFCNGQAVGAMTGWGWVALGSADTLTDPTCDAEEAAITAAAPCDANTNWNRPDALCMTGSIPALDATDPDYTGNWGVQIGVNAQDPNAGLGTSWKTIAISVSGSPDAGLRAVLHKNGDDDTTGYCLAMTPGQAMAITDFNSKCWDSSGEALTEADSASIDKVGVQVSATATEIAVTDLCLTKIEFGN